MKPDGLTPKQRATVYKALRDAAFEYDRLAGEAWREPRTPRDDRKRIANQFEQMARDARALRPLFKEVKT